MLTDKEFETCGVLHQVVMDHCQDQDGLDAEIAGHIREVQKLFYIRAGGRDWAAKNAAANPPAEMHVVKTDENGKEEPK